MRKEFNCKGKQLAMYLIKNGSKLMRTERADGFIVYVFENDDSIEPNIEKWKSDKKRCLFSR